MIEGLIQNWEYVVLWGGMAVIGIVVIAMAVLNK